MTIPYNTYTPEVRDRRYAVFLVEFIIPVVTFSP
jgi:hypothetical protein